MAVVCARPREARRSYNSLFTGVGALFVGVLLFGASGCAQRSFSVPRSEIIEEARSNGVEMPSIEADHQLFLDDRAAQEDRVVALIRRRTALNVRDENYRIGPADEFEVNVFDVEELNVTAKVRQSGFISLPLIGAVRVAGLTEAEVADVLRERLSDYVKNPQVSVFVSHYGSQKVSIVGAVRTPGSYPLKKGENSLVELLSEAGGISEKAGNVLNFVPAEVSGIDSDPGARANLALDAARGQQLRSSSIELPIDRVLGTAGGMPLEIPVRGGDMIIIPEGGKVMVEGEVQQGGSIELSRGMTLLSGLASAGGITYGAKVDEVELIREIPGERKVHLVLDLTKMATGEQHDLPLKNGDIVRVPSDSGRRLTQDTFEGLTRIINFGVGGTYNVAP